MSGACPTTETLAAALRGQSSAGAEAELAAHLAECPTCQTRLEEMAGGSGWLKGRGKAPGAAANLAPESLHKAIRALEECSASPEGKPPSTPKLDFLQPSDQPGRLGRFGPYEVLAIVAVGGMGIVLRARDPGLNRVVALKILPPTLAANSLSRARFIREARAAAAVVHEHVVPIYAVDEFARLPYLVMQFVQGRTLSERIRQTGPLRVEEILRIGAQTAAGLAAAHAQGLIHRDVKPGNILLENGVERVKITDFGLARAADDPELTQVGHIAGTPEYMSPEQANGLAVDQRADLFGFGCVLYEMATGISPFRAEKPLAALRRVCEEHPPLAHTLNPRIPEWLSQLIQRLMAKDPASRPQSAPEVVEELGRRLAEYQHTSGPNHPGGSARRAGGIRPALASAWLAVFIVPLLLALVVIIAKRPQSEPKVKPMPATPAAGSKSQNAPLFFLAASGDPAEKGFATLAEAVAAAPAGAVIEFRFNGPQVVPTVQLGGKPLVLRAATGFEPVLRPAAPGQALLFTRAALALEGLTILAQLEPTGQAGRSGASRNAVVSVEESPFLATHCRFEFEIDPGVSSRRPPELVRLWGVTHARFHACEFSSRPGYAIAWATPETPPTNQTPNLQIQDCTLHGSLLSQPGRRHVFARRLSLQQNTFVGDTLVHLVGGTPEVPLQVRATNNVFVLNKLLWPFRAAASPLEKFWEWQGDANVYSVESYAQTTPAVNRHEEWLASDATDETASVSATLEIKTRLANLTERTRATEATAFALTPGERQRLAAQLGAIPVNLGADAARNGPGQPYHDWRNGPDYAEWLKLVREHFPRNAANP